MNLKFYQKMEDKTRASDRRQEKQRAEAGELDSLGTVPPLLIQLRHDLGKLPAGIAIEFPHDVAIRLVQHRYATPVSNFLAQPDLVVDDSQLMHADLPPALIPLEAMLETALEAAA